MLFAVGLGTMTMFLETSPSLPVSLRGEEEEREDRHAIMIIIIINVKQRQKRCGELETMITIKMTAAGREQRISRKKKPKSWNVYNAIQNMICVC